MYFNLNISCRFLFRCWFSRRQIGIRVLIVGVLVMLNLAGFASGGRVEAKKGGAKVWVGTWSTAPQLVEPNNQPPAPGLTNNTLRQIVCVSIGGERVRLRFSNEFSKSPVTMKSVQIAVSKGGSMIEKATVKELKFNGKTEVMMAPGKAITSDPVAFRLEPRMEVAITIGFGSTAPDITGHPGSRTTSYLLAGSHPSGDADFSNAVQTDHWYAINGMDVETPKAGAAIAILGNSITDGRGSGTNKQNRWPDILALRLQKNQPTRDIGVLNLGIGGNCVLRGGLGPTGISRFDRDILGQHGVRWVIILEGVNDIGGTKDRAAASQVARDLIAAYDQMISKAHARGLKVFGGTITPIKNSFYYTEYREEARRRVNEWIRTSGHFDGVIDFDKAVRNPADPLVILPKAQSGDYLHPNEEGYRIMGEAIDLSLFQ